MHRIRIRCRPKPPFKGPTGITVTRIAGWRDVEVVAVAEDGTEMPLTNVQSVSFTLDASEQPARAVVTFLQPEIDVEAVVADNAPAPDSDAARALKDVQDARLLQEDCGVELSAADVQRVRDMPHVERVSRVGAALAKRRQMFGEP